MFGSRQSPRQYLYLHWRLSIILLFPNLWYARVVSGLISSAALKTRLPLCRYRNIENLEKFRLYLDGASSYEYDAVDDFDDSKLDSFDYDDDDNYKSFFDELPDPHDNVTNIESGRDNFGYRKEKADPSLELATRLDDLQRQIKDLTRMAQSPVRSMGVMDTDDMPFAKNPQKTSVAPLTAMLFVDGTWLYYALHARPGATCPIKKQLGENWAYKYKIDWTALPRVISKVLQSQDMGWSQSLAERPIEIVRVCAFTSYKSNTPKHSFRVKMFQDMIDANYDVHMMENMGNEEKCVDIQLAVDMLHFATVPNAYDVALLLTGDKDFMPAMHRTRQKGRRVGLVSIRPSCNRALVDTPNIKDFDVVWLEDCIESMIVSRRNPDGSIEEPKMSKFTLLKVIFDFISKSGYDRVNSRDIGKYLRETKVGSTTMLTEVKTSYGGLYPFIVFSDVFEVASTSAINKKSGDNSFLVQLRDNSDLILLGEARKAVFTKEEKRFFDSYNLQALSKKESYYHFTIESNPPIQRQASKPPPKHKAPARKIQIPDYSMMKVNELKAECRAKGLPVSGKRAELIARLNEKLERNNQDNEETDTIDTVETNDSDTMSRDDDDDDVNGESASDYLLDLVVDYLRAFGGEALSNDIGRYLNANSASPQAQSEHLGIRALDELKEKFGSVGRFINSYPSYFERKDPIPPDDFSFKVVLKDTRV